MLVHPNDQDSFEYEQQPLHLIKLKTIKQMINEDQSFAFASLAPTLTLRIKGMVLLGLISKNKGKTQQILKQQFLRWYAQSNTKRHEQAINKFLTKGKITKQKMFYQLKIMTKKQLKNEQNNQIKSTELYNSNSLDKKLINSQSKQSFQLRKKNKTNHNRVNALAEINNTKQKRTRLSQNLAIKNKNNQITIQKLEIQNKLRCLQQFQVKPIQNKQKNRTNNVNHFFVNNNTSINNILLQSQTNLSGNEENKEQIKIKKTQSYQSKCVNQLQKYKSKQSISLIDPVSGNLQIQLITCTNLFQNSSSFTGNKATSKLAGIIELCRHTDKIKNKQLNNAFRKLLQNQMQEDYENQLLKVKRHLQLVQQNFMVQCEIQAIAQNYEQQNQHLQTIDNQIQVLKQKFMFSKTVSIVRALKKLVYPTLREFYIKIQEQIYNNIDQNYKNKSLKMYEVQQINASSTSLSFRANGGSNNLLNFAENEDKQQLYNNLYAVNTFNSGSDNIIDNQFDF